MTGGSGWRACDGWWWVVTGAMGAMGVAFTSCTCDWRCGSLHGLLSSCHFLFPLRVTPVCYPSLCCPCASPLCVQNHPVPVPRALALGTIPPLGHQPVFAVGPGAIQLLHHAALHSQVHLLAIPSQAEEGACHGCDGDAGTVVADGAVGAVETVGAH